MWRRLEVDDYDAVMSLRQAVLSSLPDPDFYVREDDEHMFVAVTWTCSASRWAFSMATTWSHTSP